MNLRLSLLISWSLIPFLIACTPTADLPPIRPIQTLSSVKESSITQTKHHQESSETLLDILDPSVTTFATAIDKAQNAQAEGKIERALFYYIKALQFEPNNVQVKEQIAVLHEQNNKPESALKIYRDILKIDNNNAVANEQIGLNYLKNRLYDQAKQHLELAVAKDASRWKAHNGLGIIADLNKQYNNAVVSYQKALTLNPGNPMLFNNIGYSYYLNGEINNARNYFNQALSFDSQYQRAIYNLGLIEIKQQQYEAAVELFNRIMQPHESYNNIGYICMLNGEYDTAESFFKQAIDASPSYFPQAQENLDQLEGLRRLKQ